VELFLHNVAGDPDQPVQAPDRQQTRETDLGASVASVSEEAGNPALIGFGDVPAAR
jgi:hypothetical protein